DDNYHSLSTSSSTEQIGVIFQTPPMDPEVMREMSRAIADGMRQGMLSKELLRNPTVYVGDRKKPELLFIFLDQVERFGKSHGFQNAELVPYAGKSLGGDAYLWYAANEDRLLNGGWDYFVRALKSTYLHPNFQQDLLVKLENGKQRGSAVAYSDEFQKLYRMVDSYYHQETIARHWFFSGLKDHVKAAIIGLISRLTPGATDFNSPLLFVRKSDGSFRLCVDYRLLNLSVITKQFSMPVASELLKQVAGYRYYSQLDLTQAFHQLKLTVNGRKYTAFTALGRRYAYNVLPFGYVNAPAHLQEVVQDMLAPLENVVNYIDDIIVYSNDLASHKNTLKQLFDVLTKNHFYVKGSKCVFGVESVKFLGQVVSGKGCAIPEASLAAVTKLVMPTTGKEVRSVLGFFNFFRSFIDKYAEIAGPLYELVNQTRISVKDVHVRCFNKLKEALLKAPVLRAVDYSVPLEFVIEVDASYHSVSGVLRQRIDGVTHTPIEMISRKLSVAERNYPIRQKELLAVVYAVTKFRPYILGYKTLVLSDHESLSSLMLSGTRPESDRIIRWIETLSQYNLVIQYQKGEENLLADVLSRHVGPVELHSNEVGESSPGNPKDATPTVATLLKNPDLIEKLKHSYDGDDYLQEIIQYLKTGETPSPGIRSAIKKYKLVDGLLLYKSFGTFKPVCGKTVALDIIRQIHAFGHFGINKTYYAIHPYVSVYQLLKLVTEVINSCDHCQRAKIVGRSMDGLVMPSEVPRDVFDVIHLDFVTGIPVTPEGYDCILVAVCALTKFVILIPTKKSTTSLETAKLLIDNVFCFSGVPRILKSDKDIKFITAVMYYIFEYFNIDFRTTSTNNPSTNGQVEIINKSVAVTLKAFCRLEMHHWSTYLKVVQFAINSSYSTAIQMTPYQAVFGRLPRDVAGLSDLVMKNTSTAARDLIDRTQMVRTQVKDIMSRSQDHQEFRANRGRKDRVYEVGEWVLLHRDAYYSSTKYRKLTDVFFGPFRIVKKINDNAFELDLPKISKKDRVINKKYFRKYIMDNKVFRDPPRNIKEAEARAGEISAILGADPSKKSLDVTWLGCRPNHASTVTAEWFNTFVPSHLKKSLYENYKAFKGDRLNQEVTDGEPPV
ncbi:hypothetical protein L150_06334, partial [Candida albicans Ca529L]